MKKTKEILTLLAALALQFLVMMGIVAFQNDAMMPLPLLARAVLMIAVQWCLLIVPVVFMGAKKESLADYGFSSKSVLKQIAVGVKIACAMSLVLTALPILLGLGHMVGSTNYTRPWQFAYQFVYMTAGVALAEEFFYRGFLFKRLLDIKNTRWFAIILSSLIFGMSHIFSGGIFQVIGTSFIGLVFCLCREKIKGCTTLSLIFAHGLHNSLITLLVFIL
ncbi:MAG: CPBP family intramembrane glutamic endopeptidase [Christensenellales bacterium]|jgi:membrane protease YdiL (CAAX protease family)